MTHTYFAMGDYQGALEAAGHDFGYFAPLRLAMLGRVEEAIAPLKEKEPAVPERLGQVFMVSLRMLLEGNREASLEASDELISRGFQDPEGEYYLARQLAYLSDIGRATRAAEEDRRRRLLLLPADGFRSVARSDSRRCRVQTHPAQSPGTASGGDRGVQGRGWSSAAWSGVDAAQTGLGKRSLIPARQFI